MKQLRIGSSEYKEAKVRREKIHKIYKSTSSSQQAVQSEREEIIGT